MSIAEQNLIHSQDRQYHFARDAACPKCKVFAGQNCVERTYETGVAKFMPSNLVHFERVEASMGVGNG